LEELTTHLFFRYSLYLKHKKPTALKVVGKLWSQRE
jgi:hypothetical protein